MLRHPIYLTVRVLAVLYLCVADAGGWSFWNTISVRLPSNWGGGGGGGYASFHHK
jgi:hypothetical protein